MKVILSWLIACFLITSKAFSQDLITTKNGEEIQVKIVEITNEEIIYLKADSSQSKPVSEIFMVKFSNGTKKVFTSQVTPTKTLLTPDQLKQIAYDSLFNLGMKDVANFYKGNQSLNTVTLLSSALMPVAGLASAIITTAIPPSRKQLRIPNTALYAMEPYAKGYHHKAGRIKAGKAFKNFGIGCAIFGFAYFSISRYR